jgi:hypothetical protein
MPQSCPAEFIKEIQDLVEKRCHSYAEGYAALHLARGTWRSYWERTFQATPSEPDNRQEPDLYDKIVGPDLFDKLKEEGLYPEQMAYRAMKIEDLWECEPYHHPLPPRK